jgi:flagellar basal-body rod modification protein FlgD
MSATASAIGSSPLLPATAATFAPAAKAPAGSTNASGVSQTDFMKLLMAQMKHQDPTSPTSATDYVTQMAQFTSVQNLTQLNQSLTSLLALQGITQGVGLIGKTVTYTNAAGKTATGTVGSVAMVAGQPQLVINNTNVSMSQIQGIQAAPKTGANGNATIGT